MSAIVYPVLLDAAAVIIFLFFLWRGKRRGLIKTVAGILVLLLAFWGAGVLAESTAPAISEKLVTPQVEKFLAPKAESLHATTPGAFYQMLLDVGVPDALARSITDSSPVNELLLSASKTLGERLTYALLCLLYFIALMLIFKFLFHLLDRVFDLPVLSLVNGLGGALFGGVLGYLLILILGSILLKTGLLFDEEILAQTKILAPVLQSNPFSLLSTRL